MRKKKTMLMTTAITSDYDGDNGGEDDYGEAQLCNKLTPRGHSNLVSSVPSSILPNHKKTPNNAFPVLGGITA